MGIIKLWLNIVIYWVISKVSHTPYALMRELFHCNESTTRNTEGKWLITLIYINTVLLCTQHLLYDLNSWSFELKRTKQYAGSLLNLVFSLFFFHSLFDVYGYIFALNHSFWFGVFFLKTLFLLSPYYPISFLIHK